MTTAHARDAGHGTHRLVLLRHAKAEPAGGLDDLLRPLALTGRRQAGRVGDALRDSRLVPELVLCSAALRTRQTWELAALHLDVDPEVAVRDELYVAEVDDVLGLVRATDPRVRTLLVVGHEPTMAATAAHLADLATSESGAVAQVRVGVPTATYSVLESVATWTNWAEGGATLTYVGRPS